MIRTKQKVYRVNNFRINEARDVSAFIARDVRQ